MPEPNVIPSGLDAATIGRAMAALAERHAAFASALAVHGLPPPRRRPRGPEALLRAIVGQQVSVAAANSIWRRLMLAIDPADPRTILAADPADLRAAGLSRQKIDYATSLAAHLADGRLRLDDLPADDEDAIAMLSAVRGLGRWTAEIYLLFAEGREDVFPAGDLAVRIQAGRLFADGARPTEKALRTIAEPWRPHRGTAALFLWHCYNGQPF